MSGQMHEPLTPAEHRVLALLARGRRNAEIAEALIVSENTVKTHVSRILAKLQVANRHEAAQRYWEQQDQERRKRPVRMRERRLSTNQSRKSPGKDETRPKRRRKFTRNE